MKKQTNKLSKKSTLLSVFILPLFLGGCHTMEGVGTDVKQAGQALERSAEHAKEGSRPCPCCSRYQR